MRAFVETIEVERACVRLRTLAPAGRSRDTLAPTIVLLHGLGTSSRIHRGLQEQLSRTHRTIAVDLPGFGGVPDTPRQLWLPDLARVLAAALAAADVVECVPIGHGWGAQLAVELARVEPDLVSSVGMIGPGVDDRHGKLREQLPRFVADLAREQPTTRLLVLSEALRHLTPSLPLVPRATRYPLFKHVAGLGVPVLVVRGHADPVSDHDWGRRLVGVSGEGALIELPGAHHVQREHPVAVAAIVDEFIRVQTIGRLR